MRFILITFVLICLSIFISCSSSDEKTYSLNMTVVPPEAGSVTPPDGEFEADRRLEIAANPNQHWIFSRWEGDYSGTDNPAIITIDSDKDIAAIFIVRDYPLNLLVVGEGEVEEEIVTQRTTEYPHGTVIRLTPVPSSGWEFSEWLGDAEGNDNPLLLTIDGETEVTALFTRIEHPVTLNIVGEGDVIAEVSSVKTENYSEGSTLSLTAEPEENWVFSNWSGDLDGKENPIELLVDGPKDVTATFLRTFKFLSIAEPEEGGTVTPEGGNFIRETTFDVTAEANNGWRFVNWEGDFSGAQNPFSLTMNGNKTIMANFERLEFRLEIENIIGEGTVTENIVSGTETAEGYLFESVVELIAEPEANWRFVRWEGDASGSDNPLVLTMVQNKLISAVFSRFEGGSGTSDDPYQIATLDQLDQVRNYLEDHFILLNDVDASVTSTMDDDKGFQPIGSDVEPFKGSFDGSEYEISNLYINRPNDWNIGLFGYVEGGDIRNVTLISVSITGDERVGAIAGFNNGRVVGSLVSGSVNGDTRVGGLVGSNSGEIGTSKSLADVTGMDQTGGFVGQNQGDINFSESSGAVQGGSFRTGGFAGINSGFVFRSFSSSAVDGGTMTGGLIGHNRGNGVVNESFAIGDVNGVERVGGLVGRNDDGSSLIEKSYARGNVSGTIGVGGFIGTNAGSGTIDQSYSTGIVTGSEDVGGFAGRNSSTLSNSYWDTEASGLTDGVGLGDEDGVEGLTTSEMSGSNTDEIMTLFDWLNVWRAVTGYPELRWL